VLRGLLLVLVIWPLGVARAQTTDASEWPRVVDAVEIHGLWRTDGTVVTRELPWKPGDSVTHDNWELGLRRLWNLGIFSQVAAHVDLRETRRVAVFDLEERWTINILFRFGAAGTVGWVRVGLWDINTFGRYVETGGLYERFGDRNGGMAWIRNPRLFDKRLDGQLSAYYLARARPLFTTVRSGVRVDLTNEHREDLHYGGWVEGMIDAFIHGTAGDLRPPFSKTLQFGPMVKFGVVNTVRLRQTGWSVELRPSLAVTDHAPVFGGAWLEALWFKMAGESWTFAARVQGGVLSDSPAEFHYFLTPLEQVRGFLDNFVETQLYGVANVEARVIVFDSMWFAIMPAAFLDAGVARTMSGQPFGVVSGGLGVRFMIPRIYHSGLRVDAAWPLAPFQTKATINMLSIGVYQYF
jgi:hypothetical protein